MAHWSIRWPIKPPHRPPHAQWRADVTNTLIAIRDYVYRIDAKLDALTAKEAHMSQALDDLTAQVSGTSGVIDSAVVLINGLADKVDALIAAGNSDPALATLAADLKAKSDALAAAVAENPVP